MDPAGFERVDLAWAGGTRAETAPMFAGGLSAVEATSGCTEAVSGHPKVLIARTCRTNRRHDRSTSTRGQKQAPRGRRAATKANTSTIVVTLRANAPPSTRTSWTAATAASVAAHCWPREPADCE